MAAAAASFAAMYPARLVGRGMVDPATLKDADLARGVVRFVATGRAGWNRNRGAEASSSTLGAAAVCYVRVADNASQAELEAAEAALEQELVDWCAAFKAQPLDAVYPVDSNYSRGLEHPVGWVVLNLEILYV